jgi:hypothetical protein
MREFEVGEASKYRGKRVWGKYSQEKLRKKGVRREVSSREVGEVR